MRTLLKFTLVLLLAVVAVKFLPALALAGLVAGMGLAIMILGGLSLAAGLVLLAVVVGVVLTPLWLPLLALVGLVALIRHFTRTKVGA